MIDWLAHIWTKPLAQWTLLDLVGVAVTFIIGANLIWLGALICAIVAAGIAEAWRDALAGNKVVVILVLVTLICWAWYALSGLK